MQYKLKIGKYTNPSYLFAVTIIAIFIAELVVMIILSFISLSSTLKEAILDSVLLSILIFPFLYFLVLNPLRYNIEERYKLEAERENLLKAELKKLHGLIPICASCKKVRDDKGFWLQVEEYVHNHSEAEFTHGICPDCIDELYPEMK